MVPENLPEETILKLRSESGERARNSKGRGEGRRKEILPVETKPEAEPRAQHAWGGASACPGGTRGGGGEGEGTGRGGEGEGPAPGSRPTRPLGREEAPGGSWLPLAVSIPRVVNPRRRVGVRDPASLATPQMATAHPPPRDGEGWQVGELGLCPPGPCSLCQASLSTSLSSPLAGQELSH